MWRLKRASHPLDVHHFQTYRHPHRWKPLLKHMSASPALVHAMWDYTLHSLTRCSEHRDFHNSLVNRCQAVALKQLDSDRVAATLKPSERRQLVKPLVGC